MLKKWSVKNFKSIGKRIDLDILPLTIIAGANSSGKSTLLQSMLIAKQTVEYSAEQRPLTLNGPILKLGRFDDVKHIASDNDCFGFGCEFSFIDEKKDDKPDYRNALSYHLRSVENKYTNVFLEAEFDVDGLDDVSQLQPRLTYAKISAKGVPPQQAETTDIASSPDMKKPTFSYLAIGTKHESLTKNLELGREKDVGSKSLPTDFYQITDIDEDTREELLEEYPAGRIVGIRNSYFIPSYAYIEYDENVSKASIIADALCNARLPIRSRHKIAPNDKVPTSALKLVLAYLTKAGLAQDILPGLLPASIEPSAEIEFSDALRIMRQAVGAPNSQVDPQRLLPRTRTARAALQEIQPALANQIRNTLGVSVQRAITQSRSISDVESYIRTYFRSLVKYLGPLRDEPRPLYPLEALSDPRNVGYRGEHTAAVFDLNKDKLVSYIPPPERDKAQEPLYESLHDATVKWLNYLGVASELRTSDRGKFGHEMQVSTGGLEKLHDLTNVGVGVSQVLPIVVMSLLSDPKSMLIFEQPELHLHPRVQSRLADFFISLTVQGKQCVIETHSEYLVRRVRLRIAEALGDSLKNDVKMYFVSMSDGVSEYVGVEISSYGSIKNWPTDFFDEGDRELQDLLEASMKKRNLKKQPRGQEF